MDYEEHLIGSSPCVVAFASGDGARFEWHGVLSKLGLSHVLMRDSTNRWYQGGVLGLGDMNDVTCYVSRLKLRHNRLITLGLSKGAYAALLFGKGAAADEAIAISPVTGMGEGVYADFEPRWHYRVAYGVSDPPVMDLKETFKLGAPDIPKVRAFVSDGDGTELDRRMAERIGVTDITLVPGSPHAGLAKKMRDLGMFAELLK